MGAHKSDTEPPRNGRKGGSRHRPRTGRRSRARRLLRRVLILALAIGLMPLALALVYKIPGVHPVSTLMMRDAVLLTGYDRRWVPLDDMGTRIVFAVMVSEDARFCAHRGIDWSALRPVIANALSGEETRGASTISMQTVKNLFLWQSRSYVRKALEAPLALYFDFVVSKRRTMEIYLNIAEWAPHIYGAAAAARHYFGKPARELTAREAALLAVTLPDPDGRDPAHPTQRLNHLAATIQARARTAGDHVGCLEEERGER